MSFTGKTIVITGGSSGIGYAVIKNLLKRGVKNIANLDINDMKESVNHENLNGQTVLFLKTDVSDRANVWRSFEEVRIRFGTIDVVISNAGIMNELLPERTVQVNLIGVINTTYAAIEFMGKTNGGNGGIVMNIASTLGLDYLCVFPAYTASKHGVVALTRTFADDIYKYLGMTFVAVCPGMTDTPIVDECEKRLPPTADMKEFYLAYETMGMQSSDVLADNLANILDNPSVATVYIADAGNVKPVTIPTYWKRF